MTPLASDIKPLCLYCGTEIHVLPHGEDAPADTSMWDGGLVDSVSAGYGSEHDADQFIIALCDACISRAKESGRLILYGNLFNGATP